MAPKAVYPVVILQFLVVLASLGQLAAAQAPTPAVSSPAIKPVDCYMSNSSTVSPNYCTYYDQEQMATETGGCRDFLTDYASTPSADCCTGFNQMAYQSTACICLATFYPPSTYNVTRVRELPKLCGVTTDLCGQCPSFLVARTADNTSPISGTQTTSKASKAGAIAMGVILGAVLLGGIIALSVVSYRKRQAKKNPPPNFEAPPPGGAF